MTKLGEMAIWALPDEPYVKFRVYGIPQTKGSTKAFLIPGKKFPIITNDNKKNKSWAALVSSVAQDHAPAEGLWEGAIGVYLHFYLMPPKTLLKKEKYKTTYPLTKPDTDKLTRSVFDSLSGILFVDDKQIVNSHVVKQYGESPGVEIMVINLNGKACP